MREGFVMAGIGHYHVVLGYRRQIGGGYKFLLKHIRILPFLGGNKNTFGVRNDGRGRRKHLIRMSRADKSDLLNTNIKCFLSRRGSICPDS